LRSAVFLSHTGKDEDSKQLTQIVRAALMAAGKPVFADFSGLQGGERWQERIIELAGSSKIFVAIISPSYAQREWPMRELREAMRTRQEHKRFIPVLLLVTFDQIKNDKIESVEDLVALKELIRDYQCIDGSDFNLQKENNKKAVTYMANIVKQTVLEYI
jgi:TIR domain